MMQYSTNDQAQSLRELVGRAPSAAKIVTITSGKGGVGKSSMAVNLAIALRNMGIRVLVVDADFGLANVDVMLGVNAKYNMSHFLRGEKKLTEIIAEGHKGVQFISGGSGVYELMRMDENQMQDIVSDLMTLPTPVDIILFDTGAGINDNVLQLILASSETIVVTTPEPTAILDAYALIKTIGKHTSMLPVRMVMNKCETRKEAQNAMESFERIIYKYLNKRVEQLGCVLFDPEVSKSIKRQVPIMISHPNGQTARDITGIASTFLRLPPEPVPQSRLSKLFLRFMGGS